MRNLPILSYLATVFIFTIATLGNAPRAETLVGSNVDSRVVVAFKVSDAAAQSWMPEGWSVTPVAKKGPLAETNLFVIFIDRLLNLNSEGKPAEPAAFRGVALASVGLKAEERRLFVTRVYISDATVNPYKNSVGATISRKTATQGSQGQPAAGTDDWSVAVGDGEALTLGMVYQGGAPGWSEKEAMPYSNVEPEFHRIYRYQQIADLLRSTPIGVDKLESFAFTTSIKEIAPMFDGSEELIAVFNIPWYQRKTFLP